MKRGIRWVGPLSGIVMGFETVVPVSPGAAAPPSIPRRFTNIWKKEGGTWRMIARHANVIAPAP
jgi:hypothetical protein